MAALLAATGGRLWNGGKPYLGALPLVSRCAPLVGWGSASHVAGKDAQGVGEHQEEGAAALAPRLLDAMSSLSAA